MLGISIYEYYGLSSMQSNLPKKHFLFLLQKHTIIRMIRDPIAMPPIRKYCVNDSYEFLLSTEKT